MKKNNSGMKVEDLTMDKKKSSSDYMKKWQWNKICINELHMKEKICLALTKIRHLRVKSE